MKTVLVPDTAEPGYSAVIRSAKYPDGTFPDEYSSVTTLYELFQNTGAAGPERPMVGRRKFNTVTRKFGEYEWQTHGEALQLVDDIGSGLDLLYQRHVPPKNSDAPYAHQQALGIYSINRPEWLLAEFAGFRSSKYTVALYDTLGADSIEYVVGHAEIAVLVCSIDKVPKILKMKDRLPSLKAVVSMDSFADHARNPLALPFTVNSIRVLQEWAESKGVALYDMDGVAEIGRATPTQPKPPAPEDLCTVCYTSGTTGAPKGAMATHASYVFAAKTGKLAVGLDSTQVYLSFLPLAHCFERQVLYTGLLKGGCVGFFSGDILSIADDAQALRPTTMCGVPRLFNRIYDRIAASTIYAPGLAGVIARRAISQKLERLENGGGVKHAFWDRVVCNKIQQFFGGNLTLVISGSAPIDGKVLNFLRVALATTVLEGYGSTEGNAAATVATRDENKAGHIGIPYPAIDIRLRDVPEMNYHVTDTPYPRGEILLRGKNVFVGYLKDEGKTKEAYDGEWLVTGDVGLLNGDGNIQIIDRRKNILKLAQGEYVAVENLETVYSRHQLVQNIFVHGDSLQSTLVSVVVPDPEAFLPWARKLTGNAKATLEDLCRDEEVVGAVLVELRKLGRDAKLQGFEIIRQLTLDPVPFDIEGNGLLTSTFKLKRNIARDYYRQQIDDMYNKINQK
ncbi:medium-chain fatty acid-CoA ligase faa2 [Coemansia sp. RSA 552]|nr:medium-chain fatty acid-CoA ligase faa2 [Coemansia sp. RSA 552]